MLTMVKNSASISRTWKDGFLLVSVVTEPATKLIPIFFESETLLTRFGLSL